MTLNVEPDTKRVAAGGAGHVDPGPIPARVGPAHAGPHFAGQADPDGPTNTSQVRRGPFSALPIVQLTVTASRASLSQDLGAYEETREEWPPGLD